MKSRKTSFVLTFRNSPDSLENAGYLLRLNARDSISRMIYISNKHWLLYFILLPDFRKTIIHDYYVYDLLN